MEKEGERIMRGKATNDSSRTASLPISAWRPCRTALNTHTHTHTHTEEKEREEIGRFGKGAGSPFPLAKFALATLSVGMMRDQLLSAGES